MIRLSIYARSTFVPILNVESAQEANILVREPFDRVWDAWYRWNTCLSVLDHLSPAHVWHGYVVVSPVSGAASVVPSVSLPVASSVAASTTPGT